MYYSSSSSSSYNYSSISNINDTSSVVNNSSSSSITILSEQLATNGSSNIDTVSSSSSSRGGTTATATAELKLYQAFIFSVPIFFTFILLLLFYIFYLRRRRVNWSSLRMRATAAATPNQISSMCELEGGLNKELREMLPIIIFNQTFYVKDTQCSVCLCDFQAEEKLQQLPGCGHTFHMDCIDLWLASHTTCPLCRHSLTFTTPAPSSHGLVLASPVENDDNRLSLAHNDDENNDSQSTNDDPQTSLHTSGVRYTDERSASVSESDEDSQLTQNGAHVGDTKSGI